MAGAGRPPTSLPGAGWEDVDGRDKRGHDTWVSLSNGWYQSVLGEREVLWLHWLPDCVRQHGPLVAWDIEFLQLRKVANRVRQRDQIKVAEIEFGGARLGDGGNAAHRLVFTLGDGGAAVLPLHAPCLAAAPCWAAHAPHRMSRLGHCVHVA